MLSIKIMWIGLPETHYVWQTIGNTLQYLHIKKVNENRLSMDKPFFAMQHGSSSAAGTIGWWLNTSIVKHSDAEQLYCCFDTQRTWYKWAFLFLIRNNNSFRNSASHPTRILKSNLDRGKKSKVFLKLTGGKFYQVQTEHFFPGLTILIEQFPCFITNCPL